MTAPTLLRFHLRLGEALGSAVGLMLAVGVYVLTPGPSASLARGLPLQPEVTALVIPSLFLLWGLWRAGSDRVVRLAVLALLLLAGAKIVLSISAPEWGVLGTYHARDRFGGAVERSTDFPALRGATRIDRELAFTQETLPTFFFNDNDRFNYYEPDDPDRQHLPLAARWTGWITVPESRSYRWWLVSTGSATFTLDGVTILSVSAGGTAQTDARPLELAAGSHTLSLDYVRRAGEEAMLFLDWDAEGDRAPVAAPYLTVGPMSEREVAIAPSRGNLARMADSAALIAAFVAVGRLLRATILKANDWTARSRLVLAAWGAAVAGYGVLVSQPLIGRAVILEGGQDWLTYEYYARDILLNGPLMTLGESLGKGKAYVFQPLYPYVLAVIHWVFGEGLFGPQAAHFAMFGATGILLWYLGRALFGAAVAWVTLVLLTLLIGSQLDVVARRLLSENFYFPVLVAALLAHVLAMQNRRTSTGILSGALLGVATLTRAPTLLLGPPAALLLIGRLSRVGVALFLVALMAVVALVPIRNAVVSGRPALMATNAGATLLLAHAPTEQVRLARLDQHPVYNFLRLDRPTREVLEFIRQDPIGYALTLVPLALYTLGFPGAIEGTSALAPDLIGLVLLYLVALVGWPEARRRETWLMHFFVASHFMVMITFLPYVYGYRQVLPMYLVMLPIVAVPVASLASRLVGWRIGRKQGALARPT